MSAKAVTDSNRRMSSTNGTESSMSAGAQECGVRALTGVQELIDNLPYLAMVMLGSALFWAGFSEPAWRWSATGLYAACGLGGAVWIMYFVCPYCRFYDTRLCPCGYGRFAVKLRSRQAEDRFARQFKKHIPVIVPLWFAPLIPATMALAGEFSWGLLFLVAAFVVDAFVLLPLLSRWFGCSRCPQRQTCPWMGNCKAGAPATGR